MRTYFALASAIAPVVQALVFPTPSPTNKAIAEKLAEVWGWTPKPTTAPSQFHRNLRKRQTDDPNQIVLYFAPDNTCGFESGSYGASHTCPGTSQYCAGFYNSYEEYYTMGCCGEDACTWSGECYDYASMTDCDHVCQNDNNIIKCNSAKPYCFTYTLPGMNMGLMSCDSQSLTTIAELWTTVSGDYTAASWETLRASDASSLLALTSTLSEETGGGGAGFVSKSASSTQSSKSVISSSPASAPTPQPTKTPIGAIVGGVVGGIAVIAGIIGLVVFFLLKNKHKNKTGGAANTDPHMSQYQQPPYAPQPQQPGSQAPSGYENNSGNTTSTYFAPGKTDFSNDSKYSHGAGVTVSETPMSPAPAYSAPAVGTQEINPAGQFAPSPTASPSPPGDSRHSTQPPPIDNRFSTQPPQNMYQNTQQAAYTPPGNQPAPQGGHAPVELGTTYGVPTQHNGRPLYEAA